MHGYVAVLLPPIMPAFPTSSNYCALCRYVGNLPPGIAVPQLSEFFNAAMKQYGLSKDNSNSVVTSWISPDGHYAFVEMRSIDEATAALANLNGIQIGAYSLKIGRPKGYTANPPPAGLSSANPVTAVGQQIFPGNSIMPTIGVPGTISSSSSSMALPVISLTSPAPPTLSEPLSNVIMVSNLPSLIGEQQIKELFTPFGEVRIFQSQQCISLCACRAMPCRSTVLACQNEIACVDQY